MVGLSGTVENVAEDVHLLSMYPGLNADPLSLLSGLLAILLPCIPA